MCDAHIAQRIVRYLQLSNRGIHFACFPELAIKFGVAFCTRCCDLQSLHLRKEESFLHEVLKLVRIVDLGRIGSGVRKQCQTKN